MQDPTRRAGGPCRCPGLRGQPRAWPGLTDSTWQRVTCRGSASCARVSRGAASSAFEAAPLCRGSPELYEGTADKAGAVRMFPGRSRSGLWSANPQSFARCREGREAPITARQAALPSPAATGPDNRLPAPRGAAPPLVRPVVGHGFGFFFFPPAQTRAIWGWGSCASGTGAPSRGHAQGLPVRALPPAAVLPAQGTKRTSCKPPRPAKSLR